MKGNETLFLINELHRKISLFHCAFVDSLSAGRKAFASSATPAGSQLFLDEINNIISICLIGVICRWLGYI